MYTPISQLKSFIGLAVAVLALTLYVGCGDDDETLGPVAPGEADSIVTVANDSLATLMNEVINQTLDDPDSTFRPHDINFAGVRDMYEQAVASDPQHNDARFGAAFAGLMSFLADPALNDLYERFKTMSDTGGMFPASSLPEVTLGRPLTVKGLPRRPSAFPGALIDVTRLDPLMAKAAVSDPNISDIQNLLATSLLPKIQQAESYIAGIINENPAYEFTITPAMQGNSGADAVVVDLSDFHVILASLHGMGAAVHVFVARNLDLPSYTVSGVEEALQRNSSFLSLRAGGAGHMSAAKDDILAAADQIVLSIDALLVELANNEDQSNDLIRVHPGDEGDLNEIKDSVQHYRSYFDGPVTLDVVWRTDYYCYYDPELGYTVCEEDNDTVSVTVDIAELFDNPMDNPKQFLPQYTLTLTSYDSSYVDFAAAHFSRDAYWDSLLSIYGVAYPNDTAQSLQQWGFADHLPDEDNAQFYEMLSHYYYGQTVFGWDDLHFFGGTRQYLYNYSSSNAYEYRSLYYSQDDWTLCYEWVDATYEEWTWPSPTFNGLFPELTSDKIKSEILKDVVDASSWKRSDCVTVDDFD